MPIGSMPATFAFGTARIHRMPPHDAERLLQSALDIGFRHFDTAPIYGFGTAERLLKVIANQPDVTIATKVGLYPPGGTEQSRFSTLLRKVAGKAVPSLSRPVASGSVVAARASFEASLKRLGRDHIDLLMIHEPQIALLQTDEWMRWFEEEGTRIRAFGLAGEPHDLLPFVQAASPLAAILQTRDGNGEADVLRRAGRSPNIVFGFSALSDVAQSDAAIRAALARGDAPTLIVSSRDPATLSARLTALTGNDAFRPRG